MLAQGYGKIINMASMTALCVLHPQKQVAYNASKAAVVKITQTLGCEWADRGVNVNCLSPGYVNTPQLEVLTALPNIPCCVACVFVLVLRRFVDIVTASVPRQVS